MYKRQNLYQAACGGSARAADFVNEFASRTQSFPVARRKAILDGMLFEVFFDRKGEVRRKIKGALFNELFALDETEALRDSFQFISDALVAANAEVYVPPGSDRSLAVTIKTKKSKKGYKVEGIYIDGVDHLRIEHDGWIDDAGVIQLVSIQPSRFSVELSKGLRVPLHRLDLTYTHDDAARAESIRVPLSWTVDRA